jgi:indole-3-glycerol phosphate synthase
MFLNKILSKKMEEVAHSKQEHPFSELKAAVRDCASPRDFRRAISDLPYAIIAEIKKRSPSRGILRDDFDHLRIASIYQDYGASAISVLTDQTFFGGEKSYLMDIKKITPLPLLRKDFIIDAYQIYETKLLGGDALLLIASILNSHQLKEFIHLSGMLGLEPLVEVHSQNDLDKALVSGATIIGINNRDLRSFSTDIATTLNLASQVPSNINLVSESGIRSRQDIEMLLGVGVHIFLIGETLMRAKDMGLKLNELLAGNQ